MPEAGFRETQTCDPTFKGHPRDICQTSGLDCPLGGRAMPVAKLPSSTEACGWPTPRPEAQAVSVCSSSSGVWRGQGDDGAGVCTESDLGLGQGQQTSSVKGQPTPVLGGLRRHEVSAARSATRSSSEHSRVLVMCALRKPAGPRLACPRQRVCEITPTS